MGTKRETEGLRFPVLIADIGGTNTRFAIIPDPEAETIGFPTVKTGSFTSIDDAIRETVLASTAMRPRSAVFALAGPIHSDKVPLTNSTWVVEPAKVVRTAGLSELVLLNDFEALAMALPSLKTTDCDPVGGGHMREEGARLVLGPGTGFGAAGMLRVRDLVVPVPGEGGHIELGPQTERDDEIFAHLEKMGGGRRISAEWVVSGPGLIRLYRAVAAAEGGTAKLSRASEISAAGLDGSDPFAVEAINLFATYLGRTAGDLALVFMATGGVYLAGGVSRLLAEFLKNSGFRAAFDDKWPHRQLMASMATVVVTHHAPALVGLGEFVRAPARFGVSIEGRRWD
jgi:glucokinase